jgi:DNA ligase 1
MENELEKVLANGGEGLMLRDPKSYYERKRSKTLLKVKKFLDDEAVVIGYERRPQGDIKNMNVRMKNGIEFHLGGGLTDKERRNPPKIGTTVTFKYQNLSDKGIPRFPIYLRPYHNT